jgi:septum formation protein
MPDSAHSGAPGHLASPASPHAPATVRTPAASSRGRPLILASSSRYRQALLERLAYPFTIDVPDIDETPRNGESPSDTALRLAREKAEVVAARHPQAVVIGSDQVALCDGRQLGKPGNHANALAQLQAMRGRQVDFHTAVCVINGHGGNIDCADIVTEVWFRDCSDAELDAYLHAEKPYDVAGSAKSEALGIALLDAVRSDDPTALVGLPLITVARMLRQAGLDLFGAP